jgi:L-amino acid N-acyltransferase YncA
MACAFRPLAREDLSEAVRIYNHYVVHSTSTFHTVPRTEAQMAAMLLGHGEPFAAYALTEEGRLIGYCALVPFSGREAYTITAELSLYMDPGELGKGYGQAMLTFLEGEAAGRGFVSLISRVCADNAASVGLFEKNGYRRVGVYEKVGCKFGKLLDVIAYQKVLGRENG